MPTVKGGSQTPQGGSQSESQIEKTHREDHARDDLKEAFAGDENDGPFGDSKQSSKHSTNVKSRKTEQSKTKTPIR